MSDCCDLKCDREFSKINDSHFQHLGVIKIAKSSSNLALYFQMRFPILVHCDPLLSVYVCVPSLAQILANYKQTRSYASGLSDEEVRP